MADMTRFVTFSVDQKYEGKYLTTKLLMILAYAIFCIGVIVAAGAFAKAIGILVSVIIVFLLLIKVIKPLTWKYVKVDHRYTLQSGTWKLFKDNTSQSLNPYYERKVKDAEAIVPMTEENIEKYINGVTYGKEFDLRGSLKAADAYIAVMPEEDGSKTLIKFVATNDALAIMKYYNSAATVVTAVYH